MRIEDVPKPWYVDVGCGATAVPFANILVDNHLEDGSQRFGKAINHEGRCLIEGDVCELPFRDGEVEFIWCSHVLEHVERPDAALTEIQRVATKGLILLPSVYAEAMAFQANSQDVGHRWLCWRDRQVGLMMLECDTTDRKATLKALAVCGAWPMTPQLGYGTDLRMGWGWGDWMEYVGGLILRIEEGGGMGEVAHAEKSVWVRGKGEGGDGTSTVHDNS